MEELLVYLYNHASMMKQYNDKTCDNGSYNMESLMIRTLI